MVLFAQQKGLTMNVSTTEHPVLDDTVLVVVDVQGRLARLMHESDAMIHAQGVLIRACRLLDIPVVWANSCPTSWGPLSTNCRSPCPDFRPAPSRVLAAWEMTQSEHASRQPHASRYCCAASKRTCASGRRPRRCCATTTACT